MLTPAFRFGHALGDILVQKCEDSFRRTQSMRNYVVTQRPELLEFPPTGNPQFERILAVARSWGLKS